MTADGSTAAALDWLEAQREAFLETVAACVRIPSVAGPAEPGAPFGSGVRAALDFVLDWGASHGFRTAAFDGYAAELEWGEGPEVIGVLGHVDVVPAGDGWSVPPFSGMRRDGRIWGRGAADDKGPMLAAAYAAAALAAAGFKPGRRLRLIFGGDEEQSWRCLDHYFARRPQPDFGFSPDAVFPVVHAEKGILDVALEADLDPPAGLPQGGSAAMTGSGGERSNMVPSRAVIRVDAAGRSAHGSTPEAGVNAVAVLLETIRWMAEEPHLEFLRLAASDTSGSVLGAAGADEVSGALTSSLGTLHLQDGKVEAVFNIRYPVLWTEEQVLAGIRSKLEGRGWRVERKGGKPPLYLAADDPLVQALQSAFREETGEAAEPLVIGGGTYARALKRGVAFGAVLPGREPGFHEADESMAEDDLLVAARIYVRALSALLDAGRSFTVPVR